RWPAGGPGERLTPRAPGSKVWAARSPTHPSGRPRVARCRASVAVTRGEARHGAIHGAQAREAWSVVRGQAARCRGAVDVRHRVERSAHRWGCVAREVRDERGLLPRATDPG